MDEFTPAELHARIAALLRVEDQNAVLEALRLSAELPKPGTEPADAIAQLLFDAGFRLEHFGQNTEAIAVYRKVLDYRVVDANIEAGAWFRIALLGDRSGNWIEARAGYRRALELAPSWIYMATLARYYLADLAAAEEEYAEAVALYKALEAAPPHPEIRPERILLELGRCLLRNREREEARNKLEGLLEIYPETPLAVEGHRLLAEIDEQAGDFAAAARRYQSIVKNRYAEPVLRAAAAHRVLALQQSRL